MASQKAACFCWPLAHAAQGTGLVQRKDLFELFVALCIKVRVEPAVKAHHIAQPRLHKVEPVIGDGGDARLHARVFPDGLAVKGHAAAVLMINARQVAQQRRLARAVRPHKAVDRAARHAQIRAVERGKAVKGLLRPRTSIISLLPPCTMLECLLRSRPWRAAPAKAL